MWFHCSIPHNPSFLMLRYQARLFLSPLSQQGREQLPWALSRADRSQLQRFSPKSAKQHPHKPCPIILGCLLSLLRETSGKPCRVELQALTRRSRRLSEPWSSNHTIMWSKYLIIASALILAVKSPNLSLQSVPSLHSSLHFSKHHKTILLLCTAINISIPNDHLERMNDFKQTLTPQ